VCVRQDVQTFSTSTEQALSGYVGMTVMCHHASNGLGSGTAFNGVTQFVSGCDNIVCMPLHVTLPCC
jgi:hypothetical protein